MFPGDPFDVAVEILIGLNRADIRDLLPNVLVPALVFQYTADRAGPFHNNQERVPCPNERGIG